MKRTVLLTRPRAASERFASRLNAHGFDCKIEPLLTIEPTHHLRPEGIYDAVMITSSNALDALQAQKSKAGDLLSLPCFCVGSVTGEAARAFGFQNIYCGASDSLELAQLCAPSLKDKSILHISSDTTDGKARVLLSQKGVNYAPWIVYQALARNELSAETYELFTSQHIYAIPVFSPRTARILVSLIEKNSLSKACSSITALGLSQAVADVLQLLPWRTLLVASHPSEDKMLACLQTENP